MEGLVELFSLISITSRNRWAKVEFRKM